MAETALAMNGTHEPMITVSEVLRVHADMLRRLTMTRAGVTFQGHRDLYATLGYARALRYEDYLARYARGGIAARIIDAFPEDTWRKPPVVREIGKPDEAVQSPFEQAWETLATRLKIWQVLTRVDRLASIGHYAVLVLGLRGQVAWDEQAKPVAGGQAGLLYLNAYSEEHAKIQAMVSDEKSLLFGRPAIYVIDFSRRAAEATLFDAALRPVLGGQYGSLVPVHASRVIHIAEHGLEDDIMGTPRLRAVWNYLDDLEKVLGGSGEMFWQDAKRRLVLSLAADAKMDPHGEEAGALKTQVEEFVHELRNFLAVQGMEVTQLEGKIPDPSGNVDKLINVIAGAIGIPQRKLIGSEQGELASSQDENNWLGGRIPARQHQYAEPIVLRQVIDRCILFNVLPIPAQGYAVDWPNLLGQSEKEEAETAKLWTEALKNYVGPLGAPQDILALELFLQDFIGYPKEQVQRNIEMLDAAHLADQGGGVAHAA